MKIKRKYLNKFIEKLVEQRFEEWSSEDNVPSPLIVNEPPIGSTISDIQPAPETQVSAIEVPINDNDWQPGNNQQLGWALKQMAEMVPESEIAWFYAKVRNLIDKSIDHIDSTRMEPRLGEE